MSHIDDMHHPVQEIRCVVDEEWEWGYEYEVCHEAEEHDSCWECEQYRWIILAYGHHYTWIPQEFRNGEFYDANIFIGGGLDLQCLQDWRDVLDHQELDFTEIEEMIYRE